MTALFEPGDRVIVAESRMSETHSPMSSPQRIRLGMVVASTPPHRPDRVQVAFDDWTYEPDDYHEVYPDHVINMRDTVALVEWLLS